MEHWNPSATTPRAGIAPAAAYPDNPTGPAPAASSRAGPIPAPRVARKPRRCTADYRWTQPKVIAFLEALSHCGRVAEAARAVGMSSTSAYRLRARMGSARFDAAFEGARKSGTRARAAASLARARPTISQWDGPGIAEMKAAERALAAKAHGVGLPAQGCSFPAQGAAQFAQGANEPTQGAGFSRKVTENIPGPCNTRSMSRGGGPA